MSSVLQQFLVGKEEHGNFRVCGREFLQDEDFGVHDTAKDTEYNQSLMTRNMVGHARVLQMRYVN